MFVIAMAFALSIHEAGFLKLANQLTDFARHPLQSHACANFGGVGRSLLLSCGQLDDILPYHLRDFEMSYRHVN